MCCVGLQWARPVASLKRVSVIGSEPKMEITFDDAEIQVSLLHLDALLLVRWHLRSKFVPVACTCLHAYVNTHARAPAGG